jgi:pimeloyl-ACP methyl ester carboxylesterase
VLLCVCNGVHQVVQAPAVLVGNSAGALTALQVAVAAPRLCRGLLLLNCTMRRNHQRNQNPLLHPFITAWQWLLQVSSALLNPFAGELSTVKPWKLLQWLAVEGRAVPFQEIGFCPVTATGIMSCWGAPPSTHRAIVIELLCKAAAPGCSSLQQLLHCCQVGDRPPRQ